MSVTCASHAVRRVQEAQPGEVVGWSTYLALPDGAALARRLPGAGAAQRLEGGLIVTLEGDAALGKALLAAT